MSTTVTYKGETLTTVDNATKTLLTSRKYMEDDLTLVDETTSGDRLYYFSEIGKGTSTGTITESANEIDIVSTGSSTWSLYAYPRTSCPTYGDLEGHTIHLEYDFTLSDAASGDEFSLAFDASSSQTGTSRDKYFTIVSGTYSDTHLTGSFDFVIDSDLWTGGTGTVTSASFLRYRLYLHGSSGATLQAKFKFYDMGVDANALLNILIGGNE